MGMEEEDASRGFGRVTGQRGDEGRPAVGDRGNVSGEGVPKEEREFLVGARHWIVLAVWGGEGREGRMTLT